MLQITKAVGRGVANPNKADVLLVQKLLNAHRKPPLPPLAVDGLVGPKTIEAINDFQRRVVKMSIPDGRVDPTGPTFRALAAPATSAAPPVAGDTPTRLEPAALAQLTDPAPPLVLGGMAGGEVKAGDTWLGTDGERLILSASPRGVVFALKPTGTVRPAGVYRQSARGFADDVSSAIMNEVVRRATPFVRLAQWQVQFILGVVSGTSVVGFVAVVGIDAVAFVVNNHKHFDRWARMAAAGFAARATLKQYAPTLYDKLFDAALLVLFKDVVPNSPAAVGAAGYARLVGVVVGSLGKAAVQGKFSAAGVVWTVASKLAVKCLFALPKAMSATAGEYKESADKIIERLRSIGVTITPADVQKIFDEIRAHPKEIADGLKAAADAAQE